MQLGKFGITGILTTAAHFAMVWFMVRKGGLAAGIANGIAFAVSSVVGYLLNTLWSFNADLGRKTLARYSAVCAVGALLSAFVGELARRSGLDFRIGILFVAVIVPPLVYIIHKNWTYKHAGAAE